LGSFGNFEVFGGYTDRRQKPEVRIKTRRQEEVKTPNSKHQASEKPQAPNLHASMVEEYFFITHDFNRAEEKKTGPSRFRPDFWTELTKFQIYKHAS
jgi:hypothetical protein